MAKRNVICGFVILVVGSAFYAGETEVSFTSIQQQLGTIEGVVKDREGNSASGIKLIVQSSDIKRETTTEAEGRYNLQLPEGVYEVSAGTECNQSMFYQKGVKVTAGQVTSLGIRLNLIYSLAGPDVSIYHLIANPAEYHNRLIRIQGFLHLKSEDSAIYASKDDADYLIGKNALWVQYSFERPRLETSEAKHKLSPNDLKYFDGKYVLIEGVFNMSNCGHMGGFSGEIKNVTSVRELKRIYDGKKELP